MAQFTADIAGILELASVTQPAQGRGMHDADGGWMGGWAGGGMWLWTVIGVLVVVLLVMIVKLAKT